MSSNDSQSKEEVANVADDAEVKSDKNHADLIALPGTSSNVEINAEYREKLEPPFQSREEKVLDANLAAQAKKDDNHVGGDTEQLTIPANKDADINAFQNKEQENLFSKVAGEVQNTGSGGESNTKYYTEYEEKKASDLRVVVDTSGKFQSAEVDRTNNANSITAIDIVKSREGKVLDSLSAEAKNDDKHVGGDTEQLATPPAIKDADVKVFQITQQENLFSKVADEVQNTGFGGESSINYNIENEEKRASDLQTEVDTSGNSQPEELDRTKNANSNIVTDIVEQETVPTTISSTTELQPTVPIEENAMECDNMKPNIISVIVLPDPVANTEASTLHPKTDEELNENELKNNTKHDIPMSITEIALREMQQFEAIKDSNSIITPLAPTSGLGLLASQYDSSEDDDEDSSSSDSDSNSSSDESVQEVQQQPSVLDGSYRNRVIEINSGSDSDSSCSFVELVSQTTDIPNVFDVDVLEEEDLGENKHRGPVRVKGEILLEDLPPIHDLHITVPETECVELGKVHSIVDQLVLVDSIPGTAPLNLDTVLFLEKGQKVLGEVFDVLGQVTSPLYCIRFNSNKQIKERGIEIGQVVYMAPRTEHTHFVILDNMMKLRGSDASWENDTEPSEKHLDYSDDEQERSARRALRNRDRDGEESDLSKRQRPAPSPSPSLSPQPTSRFQPRQHRQRPPRYRGSAPNDGYNHGFQYPANPRFHHPPPFMYGPSNASWHANFNPSQPPPPIPYQYHSNPPYFAPHSPFMPPTSVMQRPPYIPPPESMQQGVFVPPPEAMQHRFFPPPPPSRQ